MEQARLAIDPDRLLSSLDRLAQIGRTPAGGVTRLALTDEDKQARDLLCDWLRDADLDVRIDDLGNIFGWRRGQQPELAPVLVGSHLDTVLRGGQLDGSLGTLAALEFVRALNDQDISTRRTVGVAAFSAEEGARFEPPILGSSVITGRFDPEYVYSRADRYTGATFGDELQRIGYQGVAVNRPPQLAAFLELHVEQGPILEQEGVTIGVVEGIAGLVWLEVTLTGQADHAGTTPMENRRDALIGAARIIEAVHDVARTNGDGTLITVGRLKVEPDVTNIIPGRVVLSVDVRQADPERLERGVKEVEQIVARIAVEERLGHSAERIGNNIVARFDPELVNIVASVATDLGFSSRRLTGGAGHDSLWMSRICPTAMVFVPSIGGRSHCEDEQTSPEHVIAGARVLANAALRVAQQ